MIELTDDQLEHFAATETQRLPEAVTAGWIDSEGARIWYTVSGDGPTLVLLHGGLGHSGNWVLVVPALVEAGWQVIAIDSRGHGRSTRDAQAFSYDLMARDTATVLDHLGIARASLVGWSDGACTALALAKAAPDRVAQIVFFACNVDASGAKPFVMTPTIENCIGRHRADYRALSATPDDFEDFMAAVNVMQASQPDYSTLDLGGIEAAVVVVQSPDDEFIYFEHARYLADALPNGRLVTLAAGTHFALLQRSGVFWGVVVSALGTGS